MHKRKKGGERKDHKVARMHQHEQENEAAKEESREQNILHPDQPDIVTYKQGSGGDKNVDPSARHNQKPTK